MSIFICPHNTDVYTAYMLIVSKLVVGLYLTYRWFLGSLFLFAFRYVVYGASEYTCARSNKDLKLSALRVQEVSKIAFPSLQNELAVDSWHQKIEPRQQLTPKICIPNYGHHLRYRCVISFLRYGYYVLAMANHGLHVEYAHRDTKGYSDVVRTYAYAATAVAEATTMTMTRDDGELSTPRDDDRYDIKHDQLRTHRLTTGGHDYYLRLTTVTRLEDRARLSPTIDLRLNDELRLPGPYY